MNTDLKADFTSWSFNSPAVDNLVRSAPSVFVVFASAQEIKFLCGFTNRVFDGMREQQCAGTVLLKLGVEAAEVVIRATQVVESVKRRNNAIVNPQCVQSQRSDS